MTSNPKSNKPRHERFGVLKALQKNITLRAGLCIVTIALTVLLLFALTLAWSTNVVQTDGLVFTTEKWNFNGQITVYGDTPSIAPGDTGLVSMRLRNDGETVVAAGVTVSKAQMSEAMRRRIYFYVDDEVVRNGETVKRAYVGATGGYTYTLFPGSEMIVNEETAELPALHWEWVYDVLGYYVSGTLDPSTKAVAISDYIRPVVYDYDPMKTTFDAQGFLTTVDGTKTTSEFLSELSASDGYEGMIDPSKRTAMGYYPVSVDENGNGVWLYLCKRLEIVANTEEDTALGTAEPPVTCTAIVRITGWNVNADTVVVDSETKFREALSQSQNGIIQLSGDVTVSEVLTMATGTRVMLDLNGHTLTSSAKNVFVAEPDSVLQIMNGAIRGGSDTDTAIRSVGADVTLSGVTVENVKNGVNVYDYEGAEPVDSRIHLVDSRVTASSIGVMIRGNGNTSAERTVVIVEGCEINGTGYAGISGNGTYYGTDIRITDSTVSGFYTAVYHPQKESVLTVENSTLSGWTGMAIKGGTVHVTDSTVNGTGAAGEPAYNLSGWTDTGDGIYLEANYEWLTEIYISGAKTKVTSANAQAVRKFEEDVTHASITVSDGSFSSNVSAYLAEGVQVRESEGRFLVGATAEIVETETVAVTTATSDQ